MPDDLLMFWGIHLFLGIILPAMVWFGCCRRDEETTDTPASSPVQPPRGGGYDADWDAGRAK